MLPSTQLKQAAAILAGAAIGITATAATATPPTGVTATTIAERPFNEAVHINSDRIKFQTKEDNTVRIQDFSFAAGGDSGWHRHPGVLLAVVVTGSVTVWDQDCNQKTYGPGLPLGAVFVEGDNEVMKATSSEGATEVIWHAVPVGSPYRIEDDPPACASAPAVRTVPKSR